MRRIFLLLLLLVFLFSGCNLSEKKNQSVNENLLMNVKSEEDETPAYGDQIITSLPEEIYDLNFLDYKTSNEEEIIYLIADSMVSYDNKLNIVPRLAKKWEINPSRTEITFYLRKGVKFTDGVELTSKDVEYTYRCIFDPKNKLQDLAESFKDLKDIKCLDKYTIKFTFSQPQPFIMDYFVDSFILPEHIYNTNKYSFHNNPANKKPVGTGPFKLVKWVKDREIVLEANKDYFAGRPYLDRIIYLKGGNFNIEFERLKRGEFDLVPISITAWKFKTEIPEIRENFVKYKYYIFAFYFVAWNVHKKPLNDRRVRLALAYLSDLERFNRLSFFGLYKVAVSPIHPQSKYFNRNLKPFPYDFNRAMNLLRDAGYVDRDGDGILEDKDGTKLEITLLTQSLGGIFKKVPVYLQENFKKAGIKLNIDVVERGLFLKRLTHLDYGGVLYGWSISPTPTYIFPMFSSSSAYSYSLNINNYYNPDIEKLLKKLKMASDEKERINICYRIQNIIYKEQPYLFLFYPSALVLAHKRYRNLKPSPLGMFKWYPGIARVYVPKALQKKR